MFAESMKIHERPVLVLALIVTILATNPGPPVAGQPFLHAAGGTYNFGGVSPGSLVFVVWRVESAAPEPFRFLLRGPLGWNDGKPHPFEAVTNRGAGSHWNVWGFRQISPIVGSYTVTAVLDGRELVASFTTSSPEVLARPSVRIPSAARERVSLIWTAVPGALSYVVLLIELSSSKRVVVHSTRETAHTFDGLSLDPGRYLARVGPVTVDATQPLTILPQQVNGAIRDEGFTIR